jgi:short subunit dehydrogenase-like uncharacterized protein
MSAIDRQAAQPRAFDVIVYGATGFTGRLVAEHLLATYGVGGDISWAMAGRSLSKLKAVRSDMGASDALPVIVADASDPASLRAMVTQTRVVITTVGPYQLYGEGLVMACADTGTDYVDLCGEPGWMAQMIGAHSARAKASGARIVFSCGFDSIPFDLGVLYLQDLAKARYGAPLTRVHGRVRKMKGTFSGGTVASMMATVEAQGRDPGLAAVLADPFAMAEGFKGPTQPAGTEALLDADLDQWSAPFVMAMINTKVVHRSNLLLGHAYGEGLVYDEMMFAGSGEAGRKKAKAMTGQTRIQNLLIGFGPTRALLSRFALPKPGEGPDKTARETGHFDVMFCGQAANGEMLKVAVTGDKDPGYGSTSKMIAESALCLAREVSQADTPGGIWTPASAMGQPLIARLRAKAGLTFDEVA